ncbi:unnamed protein product [Durusdinium trenchii]|uniref:Uncharacterized protein n=1 Tax=Durusdinium trenchii TaxID=1381693 RepID=A0ABP0J0P9_9DINO
MEAAARLSASGTVASGSIFNSEELEGLILKDKKAFMKTKCAECAGSCGLAKKYKETMAVIVKSMMDPWQHSLAAEQQSKVTEQDTFWCRDCGRVLCDTHRYQHTCERLDALKAKNDSWSMQALLEQLREDEARKDALEAQVKAEQQRAAEKLEEEKSHRKNQRKLLASKAKQVESFIQQRSRDKDGLRPAAHAKLLELYPRVKRLSLALYNQFEHPDSTQVGGPDWEEVKEIYAEAREITGMIVMTEDGPLDMRNPWDPPEDPSQAQDMQDD